MQRTTTLAWALLLVAAGLTGCIGGEDGSDGPAATTDTQANGASERRGTAPGAASPNGTGDAINVTRPQLQGNLTMESCDLYLGLLPLPEDVARDSLPPDWEPLSFRGVSGLAQAFVAGSACDGLDGETTDSVAMLMAGILAEPTSAYLGNVDVYAVSVGILVEDQTVLDRFAQWDFQGIDAMEMTSNSVVLAAGASGTFIADGDGWGVRANAEVPAVTFDLGSTRMRLFDVSGERVRAAIDIQWSTDAGWGPGGEVTLVGEAGLPTDPIPPGVGAFLGGTPDFGFTFQPAAHPDMGWTSTNVTGNETSTQEGWQRLMGSA